MKKSFIDHVMRYHSWSIVLGLNDALVEITGVLSGLTLALDATRTIGAVGFITGVSAALSMAASAYLSAEEAEDDNPFQTGLITGITYILTVFVLVLPYFFLGNKFICMFTAMFFSFLFMYIFTHYVSKLKSISVRKHFIQMVCICLGISLISFMTGLFVNNFVL